MSLGQGQNFRPKVRVAWKETCGAARPLVKNEEFEGFTFHLPMFSLTGVCMCVCVMQVTEALGIG